MGTADVKTCLRLQHPLSTARIGLPFSCDLGSSTMATVELTPCDNRVGGSSMNLGGLIARCVAPLQSQESLVRYRLQSMRRPAREALAHAARRAICADAQAIRAAEPASYVTEIVTRVAQQHLVHTIALIRCSVGKATRVSRIVESLVSYLAERARTCLVKIAHPA